jgi:hypothetical protein
MGVNCGAGFQPAIFRRLEACATTPNQGLNKKNHIL